MSEFNCTSYNGFFLSLSTHTHSVTPGATIIIIGRLIPLAYMGIGPATLGDGGGW